MLNPLHQLIVAIIPIIHSTEILLLLIYRFSRSAYKKKIQVGIGHNCIQIEHHSTWWSCQSWIKKTKSRLLQARDIMSNRKVGRQRYRGVTLFKKTRYLSGLFLLISRFPSNVKAKSADEFCTKWCNYEIVSSYPNTSIKNAKCTCKRNCLMKSNWCVMRSKESKFDIFLWIVLIFYGVQPAERNTK